jgi:predicted nucleic acid-binding protein
MNIFIDTSAFLAILNASDRFHPPAREAWNELLISEVTFFTSNYILLETTALLQHRFGIEALRLFEGDLVPVIEICWIDQPIHEQGMSALLVANRRDLSLVDCTSFEIMRQSGLKKVFTFDPHFREQGFEALP